MYDRVLRMLKGAEYSVLLWLPRKQCASHALRCLSRGGLSHRLGGYRGGVSPFRQRPDGALRDALDNEKGTQHLYRYRELVEPIETLEEGELPFAA